MTESENQFRPESERPVYTREDFEREAEERGRQILAENPDDPVLKKDFKSWSQYYYLGNTTSLLDLRNRNWFKDREQDPNTSPEDKEVYKRMQEIQADADKVLQELGWTKEEITKYSVHSVAILPFISEFYIRMRNLGWKHKPIRNSANMHVYDDPKEF
jgi:hypothetical protein